MSRITIYKRLSPKPLAVFELKTIRNYTHATVILHLKLTMKINRKLVANIMVGLCDKFYMHIHLTFFKTTQM